MLNHLLPLLLMPMFYDLRGFSLRLLVSFLRELVAFLSPALFEVGDKFGVFLFHKPHEVFRKCPLEFVALLDRLVLLQ